MLANKLEMVLLNLYLIYHKAPKTLPNNVITGIVPRIIVISRPETIL